MGSLRHRVGRDHSGHRYRPGRRGGHGSGGHSGHRTRGGDRADRLLVHGRVGRPSPAPHRRHAFVRLRELPSCGEDDGQTHRRRLGVGLLAGLVPRGTDQHVVGRRVHRRALPRAPGTDSPPAGRHRCARVDRRSPHHLHRADRPLHPVLPGHPAGCHLCHRSRRGLHGPVDAVGLSADLQAEQFSLEQHLGIPLCRSEDVRSRVLLRMDLRDLLERHRHGGGCLLHR